MGLLSTERASMGVMARKFLAVSAHALAGLGEGVVDAREVAPALAELASRSLGYLRHALARR